MAVLGRRRSRVVPAAVQLVLLVEHRVDELTQRVVRRGGCSKETGSGGGGETVGQSRDVSASFFVSNEGGRVASAGRRSDVTLANVELELVRRDDEPPRKDAALLHLPPTSKPNMSNSPCVATSTRLLRSFAGGRALRSARCGAASAAALEGVGRASALGMASARTIAASIPMRRSRRNIEEGGLPVVQSVVGGRCFATVQCDQARGRRFESFQARTRDSRRSRARARSRASTDYVCRRELLTTEPRFEARAAAREVPKRAPRTTLVTKPDERNARNSRADRRGTGP